ncbi:MAG: IS1634 family transposase [Desulfobacteraceae bacterium]|nr:IS1634 family transposase [Desulfobacteraceae bacterium]
MEVKDFSNLTITDVQFLPIVKEYARRINLVDTINHMVDTEMDLQPGPVVLGMVMDTLSGRSPLYRLENFFEEKDIELLLGEAVSVDQFSDHNIGRGLDKIFETGTQKIFGQLSQNAVNGFQIKPIGAHYDTTSVNVYGDYDNTDEPFEITYGHSKDKRPDLKQFLVEMLCVDRNIPLFGATRDGNASDKTLNNEVLSTISKHMAKHGLKENAFVYVADSAFVTKNNLEKAGTKTKFISRLPATYKECSRAIQDAVQADQWIDIGIVAETEATQKRPAAHYKAFDTIVTLYETTFRAIVIHSSAHDKRRHKRIDRLLKKNKKELEQLAQKLITEPYYCEADAQAAVEKLSLLPKKTDIFQISTSVERVAKYRRGRPKKGENRVPERYEYRLKVSFKEDNAKVDILRKEAGCFVLLSNLVSPSEKVEWDSESLLRLYKSQIGIEQNFGFLKNPVIINSVFLKKNSRIEVLGMVLLISLLIWRLIERSMRLYVEENQTTITGWVRRKTKRPTSFMMSTKFHTVLVIKSEGFRQFAKPLKPVHLEYLRALDVKPEVFLTP